MSTTFFSDIRRLFSYLFDSYGFKVIKEEYYEEQFGDCLGVYQSHDLRMTFSRDRGQDLIDICALKDPNNDYDFRIICELIEKDTPGRDYGKLFSLEESAELMKEHFPTIIELFHERNYKDTRKHLKLLEEKWTQILYGKGSEDIGS
jgi:hypothetical protein